MMRIRVPFRVAAAVALTALPAVAGAQEFCVACSEPAALYRCQIDQAQAGAAQSMQVACITQLAQQNGHGQCSVKRNVTVFECDAPVRRISIGSASAPAALPAGQTSAPGVAALPPPAAPNATNEPPKTVVEAAQRANEATKQQLQQTGTKLREAGAATGSFLKQTLTCIGSLFTKCAN